MNNDLYDGIEKRISTKPRRLKLKRRHRTRTESLVCDCRSLVSRRYEDNEELIEAYKLSEIEEQHFRLLNPK